MERARDQIDMIAPVQASRGAGLNVHSSTSKYKAKEQPVGRHLKGLGGWVIRECTSTSVGIQQDPQGPEMIHAASYCHLPVSHLFAMNLSSVITGLSLVWMAVKY